MDTTKIENSKAKSNLVALLATIGLLSLSGCAMKEISEYEYPLEDAGVMIDGTQQEIETTAQATNPALAGGGVLGVLIVHAIDSSANTSAEKASQIVRNELIEIDIGEEVSAIIRKSPVVQELSVRDEIVVIRDPGAVKEKSRSDPAFWFSPTVELSNDLRSLKVNISVARTEMNDHGKVRPHAWYHYRVDWPLKDVEEGLDRAELASVWVEKGPQQIRDLVKKGTHVALEMFEKHLEAGKTRRPSTKLNPKYKVMKEPKWLWRRQEDLVISFPWQWRSMRTMIASPAWAVEIDND